MNRGLILKSVREVWLSSLLLATGAFLLETLFAYLLPTYYGEIGGLLVDLPFVRSILSALLGSDVGDTIGAEVLTSIAWVHPIVLTLLWGHEISLCTRWPAGEIDRGTIDVLLGLPVSRRRVYACEAIVWLVSGLALVMAAFAGHVLGRSMVTPDLRPALNRTPLVVLNLFCLYVAVGGIAWLASSVSSRRGRAVAAAIVPVVGSFLLNFLVPLSETAERLSFLGVLNYYEPWLILRGDTGPWADCAVLVTLGGVCWIVGGVVLDRRNICTV